MPLTLTCKQGEFLWNWLSQCCYQIVSFNGYKHNNYYQSIKCISFNFIVSLQAINTAQFFDGKKKCSKWFCLLYICLFSQKDYLIQREYTRCLEKKRFHMIYCVDQCLSGLKLQQQPMNTPRKYKIIALIALTTKIMTQSVSIRKQKLVFKTQLMFVFFCFSQNNTN